MKKSMTSLILVIGVLGATRSSADTVEFYEIMYSGIACHEDPDYSVADYNYYGIYGGGSADTYVWCPVDYSRQIKLDTTTSNFYPSQGVGGGVAVMVNDNTGIDQFTCWGVSTWPVLDGSYFDYDITPSVSSGITFTGFAELDIPTDTGLDDVSWEFLSVKCKIPEGIVLGSQTIPSQLAGYVLILPSE